MIATGVNINGDVVEFNVSSGILTSKQCIYTYDRDLIQLTIPQG